MLNSLRDGQINYGTTNCPSAHVPPHNVAPIHQNSLISTEPSTPVYQWNSNHRLEHLYGFHSRYYNLDFPTPYPPATNQYVPANVYGQNLPQCCQPCCRLRSQNIPKASPPQVLYNPRPVQQLNRSYKSKKTLKTPCSEQFLPYIPNDLPVKYDTQNCYQPKYNSSYLNNTNYCPPANNLWIPPAANPTWPTDRLRPIGRHNSVVTHDFSREKNYQRLPNYQSNPYSKPISATHHVPYNYIPPIPDVHDYRPPVNHNPLKNNTPEYVSHNHSSRVPISSKNIQNSSSSLQQYSNAQPVPYSDIQRSSESFKPPQTTPKNTSKSNLNVREFLATWDEGEEEIGEKSSEVAEPIVVLDCMTLDGDALTKIQEKLNVVSYENLEKVLKENQNPLVITTEPNEINSLNHKAKLPSKSNFEPLDYTKRETGIIKPFITEKKRSPETVSQSEKSYSVNFDGMVAWYGKKNTDISSTDLIERLADRIFNLSKSQENEGVSFGTAAYTGQITQTNRFIGNSDKNTSKYIQNPQMFDLQHHADKFIEPPIMNKISCDNDSITRTHSIVLDESNKASIIKSNNINSSCIVENITKKCLNVTNEEMTPWHLDQGAQEQHLNTSLYDHSVIMKPLDFSSLTDETKGNPFVFEKNTSRGDKPNDSINNQCSKVFNENDSYNSTISNNQHSIQQVDSSNRNFPVIVSPHRQEYNGFHESVIQRTGCDKNKHDKVPTRPDFDSINWNLSNDLDKIMKNTVMEPSCLYDRNNYNMLDSMNSDKNVSTPWKDNVPCVDLTVNSKTNPHHDSFFDGWSFIESYENHSNKKITNDSSSNDNTHNPLFPNQITSLEESTKNNNNCNEKIENETLVTVKDIAPFSKSMDLSPTNRQSRDVFNLNNRIPDFIDGFELPVINEPHEYLQFKRNDNERRTDGSIFEHLNEPKCIATLHETLNYKNDQNKLDFVGLPSFKEKEPLAPVSAPSKLNIVKPILRDPSQIYSVIKQKIKYDNTCVDNDTVISNKTGNSLREHLTNTFNVTDLKSKYNSVQLNQFDVWSEKFVLKENSNSSSSAVVQCDVEITQFKSTPENRDTLITKSNMSENYQDKTTKLTENKNCNLATDKINIIENDKMSSNDFLNCLESTKTDDQKYRDTFDEFETSFGFDIHCNNESNKSFHEDIVNKCFEERIKDQIGGHDLNTAKSTNTLNTNTASSKSTRLPFQCDFQSSYLIKNYFDENKNKTDALDRKQTSHHEKSNTTVFNYHGENGQVFERRNNETIHTVKNSEKNSDFHMDCDVGQIQNGNEDNDSNFINEIESYESNHENTNNIRKITSRKNNNFDYLNMENSNFGFENHEKSILGSTISKEKIVLHNSTEPHSIGQIKHGYLNNHKLFHTRKHSNDDFELNINNTNIFESNLTNIVRPTETNKNLDLESNKISFESKFNSDSAEKIEHNINNTNYFELDNNNSDIYHTQNSVKMDQFDFETRIIQNFEIECSTVDVDKSITQTKIFTNESQIKTNCGFEINNSENKVQQETNYKSTPDIEEASDLNCNNDTQRHNVIETENINQEKEVNRIFEVGCIVNNIQEKLNLENPSTHTDYDVQSKNTELINLNNCKDNINSNLSNNSEVETIFENIYDNLSTLDIVKKGPNVSASVGQKDLKYDVSGSQETTEDLHLKNNNLDVVDNICEETNMHVLRIASNETFEETGNVLLQELVNNSVDRLTTAPLQANESIQYDKSKPTPIEYDTEISNKKLTNIVDNPAMCVEQHTKVITQSEIELIDEKNRQTLSNLTFNTVQGDATLEIFNNLKSGLLNSVKNTDNADEKEHVKNNDSESSLLNSIELTSQQNSNAINKAEHLTNSRPYKLNNVKMVHHQNSNEIIEIEDLTSYGSSLSNRDEVITQQHSEEIIEAIDLTSSGPISVNCDDSTPQQNQNQIDEVEDSIDSLNRNELISKQNSNEIYEVEDSINCKHSLFKNDKITFQPHSYEMLEVKDSNTSGPSLINQEKLTYEQNVNEINQVEHLFSSESSSINEEELEFLQNSNKISEVKDSTSSGPSSINKDELTYEQNANEINEVENSFNSELSSINQDELTCDQNLNEINEVKDSTSSGPSSINQDELDFQHNSNENNKIEESTSFSQSSQNQEELEFQHHSNAIYVAEYLTSSGLGSINQDKLEFQQNLNETYDAEDLTISGPSSINQEELKFQNESSEINKDANLISPLPISINQDELEFQQNSNDIYGAGDSTSSGRSSINQDELDFQHNSNENNKIEESTSFSYSSLSQEELKTQHTSNEINKADDLISPLPISINQDELDFQHYSNENNKIEESTSFRYSSLSHDELKIQHESNEINKADDLISPLPTSINQDELEFQQISNDIYGAGDSTSSGRSSINQDELDFQHNSNDNNKIEELTSFRHCLLNQEELKIQHESNKINKADDLISPLPISINQDELEFQPNSNDIYDNGDSTSSRPSSINQEELEFQHNSNEIIVVEESTSYRPSSINQENLKIQNELHAIYEAEDLTSSGLSSINPDKLEFQQNLNEIYDAGDLTRSGPSSINQEESEFQHNSNEMYKADDLISSGHSSINQNELLFQHISNENDEAVDLTISRPSLFNQMGFKIHQNSDHIVEDQDSVGSIGNLSNHNELICRGMFLKPSYLKSSVVSENNIHETNYDSYIKNTDYKSVIDDLKLPRVKFILKCQSRSLIKSNIFDEESTVPYKKSKMVKDEKSMNRHIFKKRNVCYKPWRSIYRKQLIIEPNYEDLNKAIETTPITPTSIYTDNISKDDQTPSKAEKDDNEIVSLPDRMFDYDGERDDEVFNTSVGIGGDGIDSCDDNRLLDTPIPSPFDDFQSENHTPEHCGVDEYWDKSLEDEYKSVLQKTISKLAKVRTNVRDKFNSRLLARRVNETKRRKRQRRLLVADKTAEVIVGRVDDPVEPVVAAVKAASTSPVYKIKVQLPWGRIFNMNGPEGVRNKTRNTKIELGPAKVDVRLSRTPGEWQVAACRSMTSPKSVVVVRRLVLQRATSPTVNDCGDKDADNDRHDDGCGTSDNRPQELFRKLPKIVIRRNGQDNNYTSYVRSSGFESGGGGVPQLTVRLVRDRRLDAMAIEGVTTLNLKHLVPISETAEEAAADMHSAKRVRYS